MMDLNKPPCPGYWGHDWRPEDANAERCYNCGKYRKRRDD